MSELETCRGVREYQIWLHEAQKRDDEDDSWSSQAQKKCGFTWWTSFVLLKFTAPSHQHVNVSSKAFASLSSLAALHDPHPSSLASNLFTSGTATRAASTSRNASRVRLATKSHVVWQYSPTAPRAKPPRR